MKQRKVGDEAMVFPGIHEKFSMVGLLTNKYNNPENMSLILITGPSNQTPLLGQSFKLRLRSVALQME